MDYDDYKDQMIGLDSRARPYLVDGGIKRQLEHIQNDYFRYLVGNQAKPKDMIVLLNEYISNENLLLNYDPEIDNHPGKTVLIDLEELQKKEAK